MRCGRRAILKSLITLPLGYISVKAGKPTVIETTAYLTPVQSGQLATFTVTKPNGVVVIQASLTDDIGRAIAQFQLKRKDPSGVYTATVIISGARDSGSVII